MASRLAAATATPAARSGTAAERGSSGAPEQDNMDLFVLTFNCAKNLINVAVLASHLRAAFAGGGAALPDVVVL